MFKPNNRHREHDMKILNVSKGNLFLKYDLLHFVFHMSKTLQFIGLTFGFSSSSHNVSNY